jgi:ribokinase
VRRALHAARERGVRTVLNPAPVQPLPDDVWASVDYLTPNAVEAEHLSGHSTSGLEAAGRAARALLARGPRAVIVTLGEHGALVCDRQGLAHVRAIPVDAVDTTGAGDAFNGALAVALGEGRGLPDAVQFAVVAAGLACTRRGAQESLPARADVDAATAGRVERRQAGRAFPTGPAPLALRPFTDRLG